MANGIVKWFDYKKGYGFISLDEQEEDVFVHYSNINMDGFKKLDQGDIVEFEVEDSDDGKGPEAVGVKIVEKDSRYRY